MDTLHARAIWYCVPSCNDPIHYLKKNVTILSNIGVDFNPIQTIVPLSSSAAGNPWTLV